MIDKFKSYFAKLERLSCAELDRSAEKLVLAENENVAKLIAHIAEMSTRKAALELGYKNLFGYCVRRLNLSEGAVPARIHVANVSRRFPQLRVALAENRISLTVTSLLAAHVSEDNVDKLISDCAGMTRKETEEYLVALRPNPVFEPLICRRPQPSAPPSRLEKPTPHAPAPPGYSASAALTGPRLVLEPQPMTRPATIPDTTKPITTRGVRPRPTSIPATPMPMRNGYTKKSCQTANSRPNSAPFGPAVAPGR